MGNGLRDTSPESGVPPVKVHRALGFEEMRARHFFHRGSAVEEII